MKKFLLAALAALTIGGGLAFADTTPASAATPGCVTRPQYRSIHRGQRLGYVMRTLGDRILGMTTIDGQHGTTLYMRWAGCWVPSGAPAPLDVIVYVHHPYGSSSWRVTSKALQQTWE